MFPLTSTTNAALSHEDSFTPNYQEFAPLAASVTILDLISGRRSAALNATYVVQYCPPTQKLVKCVHFHSDMI